jgi:hypothetical protein
MKVVIEIKKPEGTSWSEVFDIYIRALRNSISKSATEDILALIDIQKLIENIKDDIT